MKRIVHYLILMMAISCASTNTNTVKAESIVAEKSTVCERFSMLLFIEKVDKPCVVKSRIFQYPDDLSNVAIRTIRGCDYYLFDPENWVESNNVKQGNLRWDSTNIAGNEIDYSYCDITFEYINEDRENRCKYKTEMRFIRDLSVDVRNHTKGYDRLEGEVYELTLTPTPK